MLTFLSIQNIVLIEKAEIKFGAGLCILTGETGSGKSILLEALGLLIGLRSNFRLIGRDENKAIVSAEFDISSNPNCQKFLNENDLLDDSNPGLLRIRRIVEQNAANKIYVNDHSIGVNLLAKIGENLIEIHGQHDSRGLLNASAHCVILDEFSGNENYLTDLKKIYDQIKEVDGRISELKAKKEQSAREKDYLEHIVRELENATIKPGEEEELFLKKNQLHAQEKILNFLGDLKSNLTEANSQLLLSQRMMIRNQNLISNFLTEKKDFFEKLSLEIDQQNENLDQALSSIDEVTRNLINSDDNLSEIEERLFYIRSLARKFNASIAELPQIINQSQEKLKLLADDGEMFLELENQRLALFQTYKKTAHKLSESRKKFALILAKKIEEELQFLKMENVKFLVEVNPAKSEEGLSFVSPSGYDKVRFLASINQNNFDDISKIASGGELSRFMLALKVALIGIKSVPTMIFDEIDVGIGGSTADSVGKRLKILSKKRQILVVTHQPQIASKADLHFKISKIANNQKTKTIIEQLDEKNRQIEIARMLSGDGISFEAMAAAVSLISKSN